MGAHPVAVASDVDGVAVVQDVVDQRGRHDFFAKHATSVFEALFEGHHGQYAFVPDIDEMEERHVVVLADRQVADHVDSIVEINMTGRLVPSGTGSPTSC